MERNPKLQFRRATPDDAPRILEIIAQAKAQMRASGSLQWQDGYPALRDIKADIAAGRGFVALGTADGGEERPGRESDGKECSGQNRLTEEGFRKRESGAERPAGRERDERTMRRNPPQTEAGSVRILAFAAVAFDGEPAYEAIEGRWLSERPYAVVHRLAVADEAKGCGVATAFIREVETAALERGIRSFRIDTAGDNLPMRRMLRTLRFRYCGRIRYASGERLAYEKPLDGEPLTHAGAGPPQREEDGTAEKREKNPL